MPQDHWSAAGAEFLGFAAARRGAHRRSASDSAAFLETVPMDDVIGSSAGGDDFDRLDDEQLMSMFSDVDAPAVSDGAGERAGDAAQLMDVGDAEDGMAASSPAGARAAADGVADPKRVKRFVATCYCASTVHFNFLKSYSHLFHLPIYHGKTVVLLIKMGSRLTTRDAFNLSFFFLAIS